MIINSIMLMANVNRSQIEITNTHYKLKSIPITVDDAVMNNVLYPAAENKKGMNSMVGNPVTLGHPVVDGQNASGRSGGGLDDHFSGGTISKVYNSAGVWYADASIKKSLLNAQDGGKEYSAMLENKEDIGVSTGLMFEDNEIAGVNSKGLVYNKTAINQEYDHLAMLANEAPAGGADTVMRFNVADVLPKVNKQEVVESNALASFLSVAKAWFVNQGGNGYNDNECNKDHVQINHDGDSIMLDKIKAKLTAANVKTDGLDEDGILAAYNELITATESTETVVESNSESTDTPEWAKTLIASNAELTSKVSTLEAQITATNTAELDELTTQMKAMTVNRLPDSVIGKMDLQEMKDHLAVNGQTGFNISGGQHVNNNSSTALDLTCPE